jgi:hypothetical protein
MQADTVEKSCFTLSYKAPVGSATENQLNKRYLKQRRHLQLDVRVFHRSLKLKQNNRRSSKVLDAYSGRFQFESRSRHQL